MQAAPAHCPDEQPCEVPLAISAPAAEALLGARPETWWVNGAILTVIARRDGEATLCCSIQAPLHPIGRGLQAVSVRVPDIATAILDIVVVPPVGEPNIDPVFRGRQAPPDPERSPLAGLSLAGHILDSPNLGGRRGIRVYVPTGLAEGQRVPVIYVADGLMDGFVQIADAAIRAGRARPVILVGIYPPNGPAACAESWCTARNLDYLVDPPDPALSRFDAQARFVVEEVVPFVESHYPALAEREARAVMGHSSGGAWALAMAARYPGVFGKAIAFSVGWMAAARMASRLDRARLFLAAGGMESSYRTGTEEAARLARAAGADLRFLMPNSGHGSGTWDIGFAEALAWMFPPNAAAARPRE